jgi:hypothetical protein
MIALFIGWLLNLSPVAITSCAWVIVYRRRQSLSLRPVGYSALGVATANALWAAGWFCYFEVRPYRFIPPWQDPAVLNLGMLFLLAPVAMILGFVAGAKGVPKWLVGLIELSSLPLLASGLFASAAV